MKVLFSIKPEYAEKILAGDKIYEFRKAVPRAKGIKTVVIYATKPVGMVVGEFDIDRVLIEKPSDLWDITSEKSGITKSFFNDYFIGRGKGYAIKIKRVRRYEKPITLKSVLASGVAPQSFCYLT